MHREHSTYLNSTDSYVHVRKCVVDNIPRHDTNSQKIGRHDRLLQTCRAKTRDMSATDKNICCLGGGADRHKSPTLPAKCCGCGTMHTLLSSSGFACVKVVRFYQFVTTSDPSHLSTLSQPGLLAAARAMLMVHPSSYLSALASSSFCSTITAVSHLRSTA